MDFLTNPPTSLGIDIARIPTWMWLLGIASIYYFGGGSISALFAPILAWFKDAVPQPAVPMVPRPIHKPEAIAASTRNTLVTMLHDPTVAQTLADRGKLTSLDIVASFAAGDPMELHFKDGPAK